MQKKEKVEESGCRKKRHDSGVRNGELLVRKMWREAKWGWGRQGEEGDGKRRRFARQSSNVFKKKYRLQNHGYILDYVREGYWGLCEPSPSIFKRQRPIKCICWGWASVFYI